MRKRPRIEVRAQAACFMEERLLCARHEKRGAAYWVLPGGHLEPGETLLEATARELAEEAGIALARLRLWALGEFLAPDRHVVDCTFYALDWEGEPRLGSDPEARGRAAALVGLAWLDRNEFARVAFRPGILRARLLESWADPDAPVRFLGIERP